MVLATAGWGAWWLGAFLVWVAPGIAPSASTVAWIAGPFAIVGLLAAVWSVRAKASWLLLTLVPLFANASLLLLPLVLRQAGLVGRARTDAGHGEVHAHPEHGPRAEPRDGGSAR